MQSHEFADLFPMMSDEELQVLADDIRRNGQHQKILKTEDGRILDGRNRLRACEIAGVEPKVTTFTGDDDAALKYVLSLNLTRRHLNESQRAMIASKIATLRQGEKSNPQICGSELKVTQAAAAEMLNTSERQVQKATKVRREASPKVMQDVEQGKLSLNAAEKTIPTKGKDLKARRFGVLEELAGEHAPCSYATLQTAAVQRFVADRLVPKSSERPERFVGEQIAAWSRDSKAFKWSNNEIQRRKVKAAKQVLAPAVQSIEVEQAAFDSLTDEVQTYLDDAAKRVPESCRTQWLAFLQRIVAGVL